MTSYLFVPSRGGGTWDRSRGEMRTGSVREAVINKVQWDRSQQSRRELGLAKISKCNGHTTQLHGMASTLRMRTAISPGQWQPWTAVSSLLARRSSFRHVSSLLATRKGLIEDHRPRRLLPRRVQKHSFKRQLHSVNVVAVAATEQDSLGNANECGSPELAKQEVRTTCIRPLESLDWKQFLFSSGRDSEQGCCGQNKLINRLESSSVGNLHVINPSHFFFLLKYPWAHTKKDCL